MLPDFGGSIVFCLTKMRAFRLAISKRKDAVRRQFKHVSCADDGLSQYFRNGLAAQAAMDELHARSWEYQFDFAAEMAKQCKQKMSEDTNMMEALRVFEEWYASIISKVEIL
jgi:hypothetical protein